MAALVAGISAGTATQADTYEVDPVHSSIGFAVKHMVVATVRGHFSTFSGSIDYDANDLSKLSASADVEVKSIDTRNKKRDDHLRSADFFDADTHPSITFVTTAVKGEFPDVTLIGDLTIRGVTKQIALPVSISGPITDPSGNNRIGFSGGAVINRQDYGVSWSKSLDGGGLVVSDEVRLVVDIEAIKK